MLTDAIRPLRVALLPEWIGNTLSPCASIRLHGFLAYLGGQGHLEFRTLLLPEVARYAPDVVLWHRGSVPAARDIEYLTVLRETTGLRLAYDIDDNLLDMEGHGERGAYEHLQAAVRRSLAVADEVWCSTPALSARVARDGVKHVRTLPNALDPAIWRPIAALAPPARSGPFELLYMGTRTHAADFELVAAAMDLLEARLPGATRLSVIGVREHDRIDRPWLRVLNPPAYVGASYPAFVHWLQAQRGFDAGVAPLVADEFNRCKSHIKVLDYAAIGLPAIASDVPAYADALQHDVECVLTGNSPAQWAEAIASLADDPTRRTRLAGVAAALVSPQRFIEGAHTRLASLRNLGSATHASGSASRELETP